MTDARSTTATRADRPAAALDQLAFQNPVTRYPKIAPPVQDQPEPGLDTELRPTVDHGERTYRGTGRLQGRKALVTGGDSGIGAAIAIAFAREGAAVAIQYLPSEEEDAQHVRATIEDSGGTVSLHPVDLRTEGDADRLVDAAVAELGGLDALVNNAGRQLAVERLEDLSDEQLVDTFTTNVFGMYRVTKAALPHLPAGSTIVNLTSIQAYSPSPTLVDYAATKAAINNFSKGLSEQLAPRGIRVNAIAPGPIWTPLQVSDGQPKEKLPKFGQQTPIGRAGQPAEIAPAAVFLTSAESSYVVGETLNVNGGQVTP